MARIQAWRDEISKLRIMCDTRDIVRRLVDVQGSRVSTVNMSMRDTIYDDHVNRNKNKYYELKHVYLSSKCAQHIAEDYP